MGIFGKGGFVADVIRCDEPSYLIWKWRPKGAELGESGRENAIRWGSTLRVKEGSVAVFSYKTQGGAYDYIEGPFDRTIKTANFPVLSSILGAAYDGESPFQAEVYFINLAQIVQTKFGVPYFDVFDPRFVDFAVPTAVRGTMTFKITDYKQFIKLHRLENFTLEQFEEQIKDAVSKNVKSVVANIPGDEGIPVLQLERKLNDINEIVENKLKQRMFDDFGVTVSGVDIATIDIDKQSEGYAQLKSVTQDVAKATVQAQASVNIKNLEDMQRINAENTEATLKAQREEMQYAQHMQTQGANFEVHRLNQQTAVGIAGAEALGNMGTHGGTEMGGGGMNPAGMMTGMAMGGVIGQNMAGMMNNMMSGMGQPGQTPPPVPGSEGYHIAVNGQAAGPYDVATLTSMAQNGQFNADSLVWKQGMNEWTKAGSVDALKAVLGSTPPPVPGE